MQASIIQIGNSKGIRFNKMLIEKYKLKDKVEITLEKDCIVIRPVAAPRQGWENSFKEMHTNGDDQLLIDDVFDDETWE